jgi:hypothetical protein
VTAESTDGTILLARCREVMMTILQHGAGDWPDLKGWQAELPEWFVLACAPEKTAAEEQAELMWWRSLSPDEQAAADESARWSLSDWLWWLEPENRTWYWLGSEIVDPQHLVVYVDTDGAPSPTGALHWLLTAAGAINIEETP